MDEILSHQGPGPKLHLVVSENGPTITAAGEPLAQPSHLIMARGSLLRSQLRAHANAREHITYGHTTTTTTTTANATAVSTVAGVNGVQRIFSGLLGMCLLCKQPHRALPLLDEIEQHWSLPLDHSSSQVSAQDMSLSGDAATARN